jgi:hypothetical protein
MVDGRWLIAYSSTAPERKFLLGGWQRLVLVCEHAVLLFGLLACFDVCYSADIFFSFPFSAATIRRALT